MRLSIAPLFLVAIIALGFVFVYYTMSTVVTTKTTHQHYHPSSQTVHNNNNNNRPTPPTGMGQKEEGTQPPSSSDHLAKRAAQIKWNGTRCMKGTEARDNRLAASCSLPGVSELCSSEAKCVQWAAGSFSLSLGNNDHSRKHNTDDACTSRHLSKIMSISKGDAAFDDGNRLVVSGCQLEYLSPTGIVDVLRGRRVVFTGDSMVRQVFLRIIYALRGLDVMAEHYFHQDAIYTLRPSGDDLVVLTEGLRSVPKKALSTSNGNADDDDGGRDAPLFEMIFLWDPKPSTFRKDFISLDPDVLVSAFMYWWQPKDKTSDVDPYLSFIKKYLDDHSAVQYVYLTTPWTAPKTFGGVPTPIRTERNKHIVGQLRTWSSHRISVVDYSGIADLRVMTKTKDNIHYMCIWTPKWPQNINGLKYNGNGCKDTMNLAVAMWLLGVLRR